MVIKARGKYKPKPFNGPNLKSPTPLINKIASLQRKENKERALEILHKVATDVAPLMRENNLKVGLLSEFFPSDKCLLGLNVNRGQKVLIRLRSSYNETQFLSYSEILGTTLHELVHNDFGPHNKTFYDRLDVYKDRYNQIQISSAFETTGYFSVSQMLGTSGNFKTSSSIQQARINRLKPVKTYKSESRKLGTLNDEKKPKPKKSLKELIAYAAEQRAKDMKWCAEERVGLEDYAPKDEDLDIMVIEEIKNKSDDKAEFVIKKEPTGVEKKRKKEEFVILSEEEEKKKPARKQSKKSQLAESVELIDLT